MEKVNQRTAFMYILIQEPRQEDMTHASQFHLIDSDEFLLQRSLMALQYLPSTLFDLFPSSKPFGAALQRRTDLPQFRKVLPTRVHPMYWEEMLMTPGVVVMTGHAAPDWLEELTRERPVSVLTSSEETLGRLQVLPHISAGLLKGLGDIREFYRTTGELLEALRGIPALFNQVPPELHTADLSKLLELRPRLDFIDDLPLPQPWAGRSAAILYNRLSNVVEEPSLLPEELDKPMFAPAVLNWATSTCSLLAARELGVGMPRNERVKPSEVNRLAKLLASSASSQMKFEAFLEIGRSASGNGNIRHPFLTIPVPRLDTLKKMPAAVQRDLDNPVHRRLASNAAADFMVGAKRSGFKSQEEQDVYETAQHTILQEQRLIACQATWLSAINNRVPIQLRPFRGDVPNALRNLLQALEHDSKKSTDQFRRLEIELARSLPPGIDDLLRRSFSITLFSDYPYEWTLCGDGPLCLSKPTTRIPLSLNSWDNVSAAMQKPCELTPGNPQKVLVLDLIAKKDRIRSYSDSFLSSSSNIGNKFIRATPSTAKEAQRIIREVAPEIVVIDSHGRYEDNADSVSIKIRDTWCNFENILSDPPIAPVWIVSACETAQSEALRGCVVRSLLGRGAYVVIATLARVDALIASMLTGRLFADIYQPVNRDGERNLANIFFGTQLTTALTYDPLLPLIHKAENDDTLRERVGVTLLEFIQWAHGRPVDPENYPKEVAVKLTEILLQNDLYDLHRNLESAGQVRPETLLFSMFGFPDRVTIAP
jgi:hypothetical protein